MKVFYRPEMAVDSRGYSPSALKPKQVVADWQSKHMPIEICTFKPASPSMIARAHDHNMVKAILDGRRDNGHGNSILEVSQSCQYTVGSIVAAAKAAFTDRIVCSPTSGFHHAGFDYCGAFCTFNGLIVAADVVLDGGLCDRVSILDCDAHYGDGTHDIIAHQELDDHVGHWTFGQHFGRGATFRQRRFLKQIEAFLETEAELKSGLIIYQAGADPHVNDPLGGTMTTDEMQQRDQFVFRKAVELNLPIVWNFAGGYQRDAFGGIDAVLTLHRNTAQEAFVALDALREKV